MLGGTCTRYAASFLRSPHPQHLVISRIWGPRLYVGGTFGVVGALIGGDVLANSVAAYDGSRWSSAGGGLLDVEDDGDVFLGSASHLASLPYAPTQEPVLYVTGDFNRAGVDPAQNIAAWHGVPDTDGDALPDSWEMSGIPYVDSAGDLGCYPLPGANPLRKDIYVEIDSAIGYEPDPMELQRVVNAFAAVPLGVLYPPPSTPPPGVMGGITLHLHYGPEWDQETDLPAKPWLLPPDPNTQSAPPNEYWPSEFDYLKQVYFGGIVEKTGPDAPAVIDAKKKAFRYCIFGPGYFPAREAGYSEFGGNDFMVFDGHRSFNPARNRALTFMHELGHTLGLQHGGNTEDNFKPNYFSVMNAGYNHVFGWSPPGSNPLDPPGLGFSKEVLPPLLEVCLDETQGVGWPCPQPGPYQVLHNARQDLSPPCPDAEEMEPPIMMQHDLCGQIDWNGNGFIEHCARVNVNRVYLARLFDSPSCQQLTGYADWPNLKYNIRVSCSFPDGEHPLTSVSANDPVVEDFLALDRVGTLDARSCFADMSPWPGGDGRVDGADLQELLAAWGTCPYCWSDIIPAEGDGVVDVRDLLELILSWGECD